MYVCYINYVKSIERDVFTKKLKQSTAPAEIGCSILPTIHINFYDKANQKQPS